MTHLELHVLLFKGLCSVCVDLWACSSTKSFAFLIHVLIFWVFGKNQASRQWNDEWKPVRWGQMSLSIYLTVKLLHVELLVHCSHWLHCVCVCFYIWSWWVSAVLSVQCPIVISIMLWVHEANQKHWCCCKVSHWVAVSNWAGWDPQEPHDTWWVCLSTVCTCFNIVF